jgi:hypothetical protein
MIKEPTDNQRAGNKLHPLKGLILKILARGTAKNKSPLHYNRGPLADKQSY